MKTKIVFSEDFKAKQTALDKAEALWGTGGMKKVSVTKNKQGWWHVEAISLGY